MSRNLDRRIEVLFPIEDKIIKSRIMTILKIILADNMNARILDSHGKYHRAICDAGNKIDSQHELFDFMKI